MATAITERLSDAAFATYNNATAVLELVAEHHDVPLLHAARSLMRHCEQPFFNAVNSNDDEGLEAASMELLIVSDVLEAAAMAAAGAEGHQESLIWGIYLLVELSESTLRDHIKSLSAPG